MSCLNERIDVSFILNEDTRIHLTLQEGCVGDFHKKIALWMIVIGYKCIYGDCLVGVCYHNILYLYKLFQKIFGLKSVNRQKVFIILAKIAF